MARPSARPVVLLGGPTASGKSALALALAKQVGGVVINADSMQVYRELRVLSDRPPADVVDGVPHRLYGTISVGERGTAARWREAALAEIGRARDEERVPILVGGTGLYLRTLTAGLAPVPDIPDEVRSAAQERLAALGPAGLHAELTHDDPAMGARLHPSDRQRLVRAWEVLRATGRSLADWQKAPTDASALRVISFVLMPPRAEIYAACDARWPRMVAGGALEEAATIDRMQLDPLLPAMKAHGLRELIAYLHSRLTLEEAGAAAAQATRNYAKRQVTWFRHQMPEARWLTPEAPSMAQACLAEMAEAVEEFALTL